MSTLERIAENADAVSYELLEPRDGTACLLLEANRLHELVTILRDQCGFATCTFVTALDRSPASPRFELCWQFLSIEHSDRVRLQVRSDDEYPSVASIVDLFPGAAYFERECFDMFGVRFEGHNDLRRLLMPDGYDHHPLRKEFPHQGIEPDRLYREWDRERRAQDGEPAR